MNKHNKGWSDEEKQYLIDNNEIMMRSDIADQLGRNHLAVNKMAFEMGLKKSQQSVRASKVKRIIIPFVDKDAEPEKKPIVRPRDKYYQGGYLETLNKYA